MGLTTNNQLAIASKKLAGKAHTDQNFAISEESISTNVQSSHVTVFGQKIEPLPVTNSGLTTLYSTNGVVQRIKFPIDIIPNTQIGTNQSQGYRLKLPSDWNTHPGALFPQFSAGTYLHGALGRLQIVPSIYGTLKSDGTTEYDPILTQTNGSTIISKFDPINWYFDPYSGVIFVEDPPAGYDINAARPGFLEGFLFVGDYLSDIIFNVSSGVTGITGINVGIGADVFKDKVGSDLRFKRIFGGNFISVTGTTNNVVISFTGNTTGTTYTANNGLTKSGNNFSLGGGFTGTTKIGSNNFGNLVYDSVGDIWNVGSLGLWFGTPGDYSKNYSYVDVSDTTVDMGVHNSGTSKSIFFTFNGLATSPTLTIQGYSGFKGAQYSANYGSNFTARSLVDGGYVTGLTLINATAAYQVPFINASKTGFDYFDNFTYSPLTNVFVAGFSNTINLTANPNNAAVFGISNIIGTTGITGGSFSAWNSLTYGAFNHNFTYCGFVGGIGAQVNAGGAGDVAISLNGDATNPNYKYITTANGAFNVSHNTTGQTHNHGALAPNSAILGGQDHNIPTGSTRSAILGGNRIKAESGITDTVYLPKVRIGRGVGGSLTTGSTSQNFLVIDGTTGEVQIATNTSSGVATKYSITISGDSVTTTFLVTHNKNTRDVIVQVYDNQTFDTIAVDIVRNGLNTIQIIFGTAPSTGTNYRILVI